MNFTNKIAILVIANSLILTAPALAGPGTISGPHVTKGKLEAETKGTYAFDYDEDDYDLKNTFELNYGLTDNLRIAGETSLTNSNGTHTENSDVALALRYEIGEPGQYFTDNAIDLKYKISTQGQNDELALKLITQKKIEDIKLRSNIKFEYETGEDSRESVELKLSAGAYKKLKTPKIEAGLEYFGDIGFLDDQSGYSAQKHYIGPYMKKSVHLPSDKKIDLTLGYYQGISHAADDGTLRYKIEYVF